MAQNTFVLLSLEDNKSKELASAISSNSAKKILDFLGNKEEASATDISNELNIPLATVEYNLSILLKSGLLESTEFKWSEKGKKVNLYKVAKKLIIISPKGTENLAHKLSSLLPAVFATIFGGISIYLYQKSAVIADTALMASQESAPMLAAKVANTAPLVQPTNSLSFFFFGAFLATASILVYIAYDYWRSKK